MQTTQPSASDVGAAPEFQKLHSTSLSSTDLWGRQKLDAKSPLPLGNELQKRVASAFARIEKNHFKFKSLSCWSYNIAIGCSHACRFCYVPSAQRSANPKRAGAKEGHLNRALKQFGVADPDAQWGEYVLLRPWDRKRFLASLRAAENIAPDQRNTRGELVLNVDGNRAVIFCSTTDPFQVIRNADPFKQKLLNQHRRRLITDALQLILEESTVNVRVLTRSAPSPEEWSILKQFGDRLLLGVSLPTLTDQILRIYEPSAPGAKARLRTLTQAREHGISVFVAAAPTYPECTEDDLRATLQAIMQFNPLTVFHEPINIRAENVARIEEHARQMGMKMKTEVFADKISWRLYALEQLQTVERLARELGIHDRLHLWPDKSLKAKSTFLQMREAIFRRDYPDVVESRAAAKARWEKEERVYEDSYLPWLWSWWNRVSEWPGKTQKR